MVEKEEQRGFGEDGFFYHFSQYAPGKAPPLREQAKDVDYYIRKNMNRMPDRSYDVPVSMFF